MGPTTGQNRESGSWPQNRSHHRYKLNPPLPATVHGRTDFPCVCRNIGIGGAGLSTDAKLSVGDEVQLEIKLPYFARPLRLRAVVRHSNLVRCGLEFTELSARERECIQLLGERYTVSAYLLSPDPEIVRVAQQVLQEYGVSMVWRGAPRSLPLTGANIILIDSAWPDFVDVVKFLREESIDCRLILVALMGTEVTREQSRELAAHMTLPKPVSQAWYRKALITAVGLVRQDSEEE